MEHLHIMSEMHKHMYKWKSLRCDSDKGSQCSHSLRSSRSSGSSRACDIVPKFNAVKVDSDPQTILGLEKAELKLQALFHHQIARRTENVKFQEVNEDLLPGPSSGK